MSQLFLDPSPPIPGPCDKNLVDHLRSKSIKQKLSKILILSEHMKSILVLAAGYCENMRGFQGLGEC